MFFEKHVIIFGYVSPICGTMPLPIPLLRLFDHETGCGSCQSTARDVEVIGHFKRYIVPVQERNNHPESRVVRLRRVIYEQILQYVRGPRLKGAEMFCHSVQQRHSEMGVLQSIYLFHMFTFTTANVTLTMYSGVLILRYPSSYRGDQHTNVAVTQWPKWVGWW